MSSKPFHRSGQFVETFKGDLSPSSTSWTWRASALKIALFHIACDYTLTVAPPAKLAAGIDSPDDQQRSKFLKFPE
jgi:hypothetical protein